MLRTSEVKFAHHFAVRRNFTHKVNFTIEDNFTCPKGKLSFSVFSVKDNTLTSASPCFFGGLAAGERPRGACDTNRGSHFASKAMGARSREPRAKIFAKGETPPCFFAGLAAGERPRGARDTNRGSHFASRAMGARSREPRAKIFAKGETPLAIANFLTEYLCEMFLRSNPKHRAKIKKDLPR